MTAAVDWGALAHTAAERHIAACEKARECAEGECEEHDPDKGEQCPMPTTAGPYCSCTTCIVRETLFAAWPVVEQAARAGALGSPPAPCSCGHTPHRLVCDLVLGQSLSASR